MNASALAPTLIPRRILLGNPDRANPQIRPDGAQIAFLAPVDGILNLWVAPSDNLDTARPITRDMGRGIRQYFWAYDNKHLLYLQNTGGDENDHLFRVDPESEAVADLTPFAGVKAVPQGQSPRFPNEILVGLNERNPQLFDTYRLNVQTGERTLLFENDRYVAVLADDDYRPRLALAYTPAFGIQADRIEPDGTTTPFFTIAAEDALSTHPIDFDASGEAVFMADSRGRDKSALTRLPLDGGAETILYEGKRAEIGEVLLHPTTKTPQAVSETFARQEWILLDTGLQQDFDALRSLADGDFRISSRTLDDRTWIVGYTQDAGGVRYYRYDRTSQNAVFLFTTVPALEEYTLAPMHSVVIGSRDGLELVSYLTLPTESAPNGAEKPNGPLPLVLLVHGGPWARDGWGYNSFHQLLANRGYAVLSVNFRGSTGLGKAFVNAANREWAAKMHDDLLDAVNWAVREGIADPQRVAIMGGSYGGYATLVGLTFTPDVFACGVDIVGPSSLITLMENVPPYWVPMLPMLKDRVGDPGTEEGRTFLQERSPLTRAHEIRKPLLVAQGANDPRVKQVEADQIVAAVKENGQPVTYLLYTDEGHGFQRPPSMLSFIAATEGFLASHLGGRQEPIGDAFAGANVQILEDGGDIAGLAQIDTGAA